MDLNSANLVAYNSNVNPRAQFIDLARLFGIFLMVYAHISFSPDLNEVETQNVWFLYSIFLFLNDFVSFLASPFLGFFAGYFTKQYLDKSGSINFIKKRSLSLVIPAVAWNLAFFFLLWLKVNVTGSTSSLYESAISDPLQLIFPITGTPLNYPLHFLFDLFEFSVFFSLLHIFVGKRLIIPTLIATSAVVLIVLFPGEVPERFEILPRFDIFTFYAVGYALGSYQLSFERIFSSRLFAALFWISLLFVVFVFIFCVGKSIGYDVDNTFRFISLRPFYFQLTGSIVLAKLVYSLCKISSVRSFPINRRLIFFVFGSHAIFQGEIMKIWSDYYPDNLYVGFLMFVITPLICFFLAGILEYFDRLLIRRNLNYSPFGA